MKSTLLIAGLFALPLPLAAQTATTPGSSMPATPTTAAPATTDNAPLQSEALPAGTPMQREAVPGSTAPAMATSSAPAITTGQQVTDTSGAPVGRIDSVDGEYAVLATTTTKVRIPRTSFAERNGTLVISMTEAQVNAAAGANP